jgi:hypothetical protein
MEPVDPGNEVGSEDRLGGSQGARPGISPEAGRSFMEEF